MSNSLLDWLWSWLHRPKKLSVIWGEILMTQSYVFFIDFSRGALKDTPSGADSVVYRSGVGEQDWRSWVRVPRALATILVLEQNSRSALPVIYWWHNTDRFMISIVRHAIKLHPAQQTNLHQNHPSMLEMLFTSSTFLLLFNIPYSEIFFSVD